MTVQLRTSAEIARSTPGDRWIAVGGVDGETLPLPEDTRLSGVAALLEAAFVETRDTWWELGRLLSGQASADVSHAAACASLGSDLGLMLAWDALTRKLAAEDQSTVVVCNDPWLYRHLAGRDGVTAGRAPGLRGRETRLAVRGWCARASVAARSAHAALALRRTRRAFAPSAAAILVYGHPGNDGTRNDAYFGDLMARFEDLHRVLHVDCALPLARKICAGGRTASLHGWGHPLYALARLPWVRWRPRPTGLAHEYRWLIRRAAALENGGGGPAMVRWQNHCQGRWIAEAKPRAIAWPWENFSWERDLVRRARAAGVHTIGYQHTVIGPHQFNYAVRCNADGLESVPDTVAANGPAYLRELLRWGLPAERAVDAGSIRLRPPARRPSVDRSAPVFMALSGSLSVADRQMAIARRLADDGFDILVKEHPMYPVAFVETEKLHRTEAALADQPSLSAVVYSTGAIAVDALLAGAPCVRLRFPDRVSIDVLPADIATPVADEDGLRDFLRDPAPPPDMKWNDIFSPPDVAVWAKLLKSESRSAK